jgi:hypothetical protein
MSDVGTVTPSSARASSRVERAVADLGVSGSGRVTTADWPEGDVLTPVAPSPSPEQPAPLETPEIA